MNKKSCTSKVAVLTPGMVRGRRTAILPAMLAPVGVTSARTIAVLLFTLGDTCNYSYDYHSNASVKTKLALQNTHSKTLTIVRFNKGLVSLYQSRNAFVQQGQRIGIYYSSSITCKQGRPGLHREGHVHASCEYVYFVHLPLIEGMLRVFV